MVKRSGSVFVLQEIDRYRVSTGQWTTVNNLEHVGHSQCGVAVGNDFWIIGGWK